MSVEKFEPKNGKPSREEAEQAVETLLRWAGEDATRSGLIETPARYVRAFEEHFAGYNQDPADELAKIFEDIDQYDDMVLVKDIDFETDVKFGLEYQPIEILHFRVGYASTPSLSSFGFGLEFRQFTIDVASSFDSNLGFSPQVSLYYVPNSRK